MLNRQTSRERLSSAVQDAYIVLQDTPDSPHYVNAADRLARAMIELDEYLSEIDRRAAGPAHVHGDSMPCNVMCPAHPNTVKRRSAPSWYRPEP